jgi:competence ComEA-like helix-hairpin-helix protein
VALYTRQQLVLLLLLLGAAGVGLAVREWRAAYPEMAERAERLDRISNERTAEPARVPGSPVPARPAPRSESGLRPPETSGPSGPEPSGPPVDLNRATTDELTRLPGVGPAMAIRIVQAREFAGRFASIDDLRRVRGLGPTRLERLRPLLTVTE